MTQDSRPWTGTTTGDSGAYAASEWQQLHAYMIGVGGARANVGPFLGSGTSPNDGLKVQAKTPATTQIEVLIGSALVQGIEYLNDATVSFTIAGNASGNPRIDTVILRADYVAQTVRLAVLQGNPAGSPTPLALTQTPGVTWEIPLADIAVANGFVSITNANITPRHEWVNAASGVYLDNVLNNSGGTLETGDVVIWDTSTDRAVITTTTADDKLLAGIWVGRTANGGYGRVLKSGIGYVLASAAITRGNLLSTYTVAKQAAAISSGANNAVIGIALETTGAAGLVLTYVDVRIIQYFEWVHIQDQKANTTVPATITNGAWRTRELNTEVTDTAALASVAGNQITLQPGRYLVWASAPGSVGSGDRGRFRLQNVTDGATLVSGTNYGGSGSTIAPPAILFGVFTLSAAKALELQHYCAVTGAGGVPASTGEVEIYANVYLIRIGKST